MESFTVNFCRSQKCIFQILMIGFLSLTLILAQVLTPKEATDILKKHNEYRKEEFASNMYLLQWNVSLQERADAWAQQCMFKHERNPDVGENLFFDTDHENEVFLRGLEAWHKEKSKWGYTSHSCKGACHFTQIVWGYTTTIGCSANVCPSLSVANRNIKNAMLLVCYYYPRGNFVGNFPYARGRPCSECAPGDTCIDSLCVSSGSNSKLAPDYVKKLAPKSPTSSSSSSRSFQEFSSLTQQSSLASSHGHHQQQQTHHRREHHEQHHHHHQQQHHFKSETSLTAASASHSYSSQHSHSSQQHRQDFHSSSQVNQKQLIPAAQVNAENNYLKEQERHQAQQREDRRREEEMEHHRKHREEIEKRRLGVLEEQQRQTGLEQQRELKLKQQRQIELDQQRYKELKQKNIDMEQQRQIRVEEQQRQELKQRNIENERQRQQELVRKRQKEEEEVEYLEMLKQQDDERKQRVAQEFDHRMRQANEERRRNSEQEQRRDLEQRRIQRERHTQTLLDATERDSIRALSSEPNRDERTERSGISTHLPIGTYRVTESPYNYSVRSRYYPNGYQERTTLGAIIPINYEEHRSQRPTQTDSSRSDMDSILSRLEEQFQQKSVNYKIVSSSSHGSLTSQSSTMDDVVKLLSRGGSDHAVSSQQQSRLGDELSPPQRSVRTQETESNFNLKNVRTAVANSENQSQRELVDDISDNDDDEEVNTSVDTGQSVGELDESGRKKQPQQPRTTHLKNKWRYRQSERQKLETAHRHKDTYVMETDGRRCVDRHEECSRWAIKCHKSSAVTLSCPMSCGKCGLHVSGDEDLQGDQTTDNSPGRRSSQDGQKNGRRKKAGGQQLTPAERKARREQRRLERQRNAPSALMARPDSETTSRRQSTERTVGGKRQHRKERRRQEKPRHNQARQDLCRDDPKHVKSCKYWARKGFCLDNKLIANLYCQLSCNSCQ